MLKKLLLLIVMLVVPSTMFSDVVDDAVTATFSEGAAGMLAAGYVSMTLVSVVFGVCLLAVLAIVVFWFEARVPSVRFIVMDGLLALCLSTASAAYLHYTSLGHYKVALSEALRSDSLCFISGPGGEVVFLYGPKTPAIEIMGQPVTSSMKPNVLAMSWDKAAELAANLSAMGVSADTVSGIGSLLASTGDRPAEAVPSSRG